MKYSIRYSETYSEVYDIDADSYDEAVEALREKINEGEEPGPGDCVDSSYSLEEETPGSESSDVCVTIAADFRYTTRIHGECVDTTNRHAVLDAANAMFADADISEMECVGFKAVSIQTPDGDFIWEA